MRALEAILLQIREYRLRGGLAKMRAYTVYSIRTSGGKSHSIVHSEDEHGLIAQYCQSLNGDSIPIPRSPVQIMAAIDADQREELEAMIKCVFQRERQVFWFGRTSK